MLKNIRTNWSYDGKDAAGIGAYVSNYRIKPEELSILSCEKGPRLIIKEHHYGDYKGASLWSDVF